MATPRDRRRRCLSPVLIGILAGAAAVLWLRRRDERPTAQRRMPHLDAWEALLAARHGQPTAARLAERIQARYTDLFDQRPALVDSHPVLKHYHFARMILPGVALYEVLREDNPDREAVLDEVAALLESEFLGMRDALQNLNQRAPSFELFRFLTRQIMRVAFPAAGWETEWIEDSPQRIAFNMRRCFHLNVLTHYGVPELTPLYCRLDDLLYESLSSPVRWQRTGTLGRGNACCDFAYINTAQEIPIALDH